MRLGRVRAMMYVILRMNMARPLSKCHVGCFFKGEHGRCMEFNHEDERRCKKSEQSVQNNIEPVESTERIKL